MEEGKIVVLVPEEKTFKVDRKTFKGTKYMGNINDCSLLASWYYNNKNVYAKDLIINIYGDYHVTFPNPPHLTVEFKNGNDDPGTGRLHMSWNGNQFYQQVLPFGRKKKKSKKKKKLKSKSKK